MANPVGVLVDGQTLKKALAGRKTGERIHLYRTIARDDLHMDIVLFSIENVNVRRNSVVGYVPDSKGWRRTRATIPKVIHKRTLYRTNAPLRTLDRLRRRGIVFVNPHLMQNKARMNETLARHPAVKAHLPATFRYSWERLEATLHAGSGVVLKPRIGSVGQGIMRVLPLGKDRVQLTGQRAQVVSMRALRRKLRSAMGKSGYLLQQYLELAPYNGKPFDLRAPVQRDGSGAWQVAGIVAKVAKKHPFLTNVGRGGQAIPGRKAIEAAFPPDAVDSIVADIERLAKNVAEAVAREHEHAADLGLDIGLDRRGKAWLIEVNTRDQRYTYIEAGMDDAFRAVYKYPLAYCARLAQNLG